jgi:hypothetical protein
VEEPFMIKPGIPSNTTDLEGLRLIIAFKMSNSEMGGKCKKSLDDSPPEKYYKLIESDLQKLQLRRQVQLHWYHLHQDE